MVTAPHNKHMSCWMIVGTNFEMGEDRGLFEAVVNSLSVESELGSTADDAWADVSAVPSEISIDWCHELSSVE